MLTHIYGKVVCRVCEYGDVKIGPNCWWSCERTQWIYVYLSDWLCIVKFWFYFCIYTFLIHSNCPLFGTILNGVTASACCCCGHLHMQTNTEGSRDERLSEPRWGTWCVCYAQSMVSSAWTTALALHSLCLSLSPQRWRAWLTLSIAQTRRAEDTVRLTPRHKSVSQFVPERVDVYDVCVYLFVCDASMRMNSYSCNMLLPLQLPHTHTFWMFAWRAPFTSVFT